MTSIHLPRNIVKQLFFEAQRKPNIEVCGLVGKKDEITFRVYPVENIAPEKDHLFEMEPAQQIAAIKDMRNNGEELFAIYHTHPHGPAEPSATDIEQASYPDTLNLIISLNTKDSVEIQGFYLRNGQAEIVKLEIY